MGYYKIQAYAGTGLLLNLATSDPINSSTNVTLWEPSCPIDQIWEITSLGTNQQVKTINNLSYMLNANTATWNCNVMTVNADTYVNFQLVSTGIYYIRLVSNTTKYLTATGTLNGSNVVWEALSSTTEGKKAQQWKVTPVSLPTVYTRVCGSYDSLGQDQMNVNASYIYKYLFAKGYTKNAICGILGNMQVETTINPAAWDKIDDLTEPYGIVQWNPGSNFIYWARAQGIISASDDKAAANAVNTLAYSNPQKLMDAELEYLTIRVTTNDWYKCDYYDKYGASQFLTYAKYKESTMSAGELARIFAGAYLRPGFGKLPQRASDALEWYQYF